MALWTYTIYTTCPPHVAENQADQRISGASVVDVEADAVAVVRIREDGAPGIEAIIVRSVKEEG